MLNSLPPVGGAQTTNGVREVRRAGPVEAAAAVKKAEPAGIPATPPAEVLAAMDEAARTLAELRSQQISLKFEVDDATRRVRVTVSDADGRVLRQVPASDLGSLLAGGGRGGSGLVVDARG